MPKVTLNVEPLVKELENKIDHLKVGELAALGAINNPDLEKLRVDNEKTLAEIRQKLKVAEDAADQLKLLCCQQQTCNFTIKDTP